MIYCSKTSLLAFILVLICGSINAQNLTAYFDYKVFQVPGSGMLLETYLDVKGHSVHYVPQSDSTALATVELKMIVSKGAGIKDFRKEAITSPLALKDARPDFMCRQQFILPKGKYTLEVELIDKNGADSLPIHFSEELDLEFNSDHLGFSDIQLLAGVRPADSTTTVAKAGLDMLPYMSNVYDTHFSELLFYAELYSMDKELGDETAYLLTYFLENADTEIVIPSTQIRKRLKAGEVHAELGLIDLSKVPTGRYNLRVEALDREANSIAVNKTSIFRKNDSLVVQLSDAEINQTFVGGINNKDSLIAYIHSLRPIALEKERYVIDKQTETMTLLQCKSFFYSFWEERDPFDPADAWQSYKREVALVEEQFGTSNRAGYETDMGRIYLIYGAPNSMAAEANDPEAYPYQIWHYYKAGRFTDRRFVFYDRELLGREYTLLHSDVPGEVRNPRWNILINSRNNPTWNSNDNRGAGRGSDRLQEMYENPY